MPKSKGQVPDFIKNILRLRKGFSSNMMNDKSTQETKSDKLEVREWVNEINLQRSQDNYLFN